MTFEEFRDRLQSERVEFFNYFHDHTWENDYTKLYLYVLPNENQKRPDQTRQARKGAHFIVKRFCDFGKEGIHTRYEAKRSVYTTKHSEIVKGKECFVIKKDVLDSLAEDNLFTAYVLFETDDSFAEMIEAKELRKDKYLFHKAKNQQGVWKYYYPIEAFPLHKKNFKTPDEDIPTFQPKFLGRYRFTMTVHGHETDVHVYKGDNLIQAGHFGTITEFFSRFDLAKKGAKLTTIQTFYKKHQNFTFQGLTFVFDDSWEIVEYKVRLSKKQKELITSIEEMEKELEVTEPEIEEVHSILPKSEGDDSEIEVTENVSLSSPLICENPPGRYWDDEKREFVESVSLWDLPF